jgi:hypothetical protein
VGERAPSRLELSLVGLTLLDATFARWPIVVNGLLLGSAIKFFDRRQQIFLLAPIRL